MLITHAHAQTFTHMHVLNTHAHSCMLPYTATSLTGVEQDGSEDGHSKEKNDNKQKSTESLWTRPFLGIWMGWSSLPDCPMPLAAGELNRLL